MASTIVTRRKQRISESVANIHRKLVNVYENATLDERTVRTLFSRFNGVPNEKVIKMQDTITASITT